ncbi:hypothetical protein BJV78DRAFT_1354913 [Lactifluus subvellereus]|nr:hypothetical protein BJV78DRAFT_1354913 [Lactifluus subvellereus]
MEHNACQWESEDKGRREEQIGGHLNDDSDDVDTDEAAELIGGVVVDKRQALLTGPVPEWPTIIRVQAAYFSQDNRKNFLVYARRVKRPIRLTHAAGGTDAQRSRLEDAVGYTDPLVCDLSSSSPYTARASSSLKRCHKVAGPATVSPAPTGHSHGSAKYHLIVKIWRRRVGVMSGVDSPAS